MGRLDGKGAIITGAASGIGRASAILFAREGARVIIIDQNSSAATRLDPEDLREIISAFQKCVTETCAASAGSQRNIWRRCACVF